VSICARLPQLLNTPAESEAAIELQVRQRDAYGGGQPRRVRLFIFDAEQAPVQHPIDTSPSFRSRVPAEIAGIKRPETVIVHTPLLLEIGAYTVIYRLECRQYISVPMWKAHHQEKTPNR
jgi:hypothetical protein